MHIEPDIVRKEEVFNGFQKTLHLESLTLFQTLSFK